MAITLQKLSVKGPAVVPAEVSFNPVRTLILGPSDTGKSHIYDCLWFLLGGTTALEQFPESSGYDSLELLFTDGEQEYMVRKGMAGGIGKVFVRIYECGDSEDKTSSWEPVEQDLGQLLVKLSGAAGKLILHNRSKKGPVTGDDLRHWTLLSQTSMIAKELASGPKRDSPKRLASFSLFLSGLDDSAIETYLSPSEKDNIEGQLKTAQESLERTAAGIPVEADRIATAEALGRVDDGLDRLSTQHEARSSVLRELRQRISVEGNLLSEASTRLASATSIKERFLLLEQKYSSDIERLGATAEGIAFFEILSEIPCPLCDTPVKQHINPADLGSNAPKKYRAAIAAEVDKIRTLRAGLQCSVLYETERIESAAADVQRLSKSLESLEREEAAVLVTAGGEFNVDPRQLAEQHTYLSSLLGAFDEVERLNQEIKRLTEAKKQKRTPLKRNIGSNGDEVGKYAHKILDAWGFTSIQSVHVDAESGDLMLDGRRRISYGAGKRGIFRSAFSIALMKHALENGFPHLGTVVLDSPLKAYAQKVSDDTDRDIPLATVNECFYSWLSKWSGPGQIIVLENEQASPEVIEILKATIFTDDYSVGRQGFYPPRPGIGHAPKHG
ncbi:hypothetical protein GCM10010096_31580 [Alcaligenes pakistanensis]|uniref:Rad50/SbcC-type AAA domain-containing protein n=1 Tax=Alcaligenes pakistanensis TaxID=1482717 RepID=A0A8H9IJN7_9BURK|nr:hypothetical protein [Alcaligenes pakistanensis]GHC56369.1 hypothetical protein GCM10010096_31580 [Alcaligenes pakistanensis]